MKEGPILMNGAMVRATLAGDKTQTRRIMKPQPPEECSIHFMLGDESWMPESERTPLRHHFEAWGGPLYKSRPEGHLCGSHTVRSPYGCPGDRLWVRETCKAEELDDGSDGVRYLADDTFAHIRAGAEEAEAWHKLFHYRSQQGAVVPSIHMPRWASRIMLEITGVRVERLQDISEDDALAEGIDAEAGRNTLSFVGMREISGPVAEFSVLWESINGPGSWDANPWVWVVEFRRIEG